MTDKNENLELAKSIWGERIGLYHKSCAPVAVCRDGDYSGEVYLSEQMNLFIAAIESRYQAKMAMLVSKLTVCWVALMETTPCAADYCNQTQTETHRIALAACDKILGDKEIQASTDAFLAECVEAEIAKRFGCQVNRASSRLCEFGTKGCTSQHMNDAFLAGVRAEAKLEGKIEALEEASKHFSQFTYAPYQNPTTELYVMADELRKSGKGE